MKGEKERMKDSEGGGVKDDQSVRQGGECFYILVFNLKEKCLINITVPSFHGHNSFTILYFVFILMVVYICGVPFQCCNYDGTFLVK